MKHNFTISKMNINYKDPLFFKIKKIKSTKKLNNKIKQFNINTFSSNELINPEIKKIFHSKLKRGGNGKSSENKKNYKIKYNSHSLSNKIIKNNFDNDFFYIKRKTTKNNTFIKLNNIDNLKLKTNYKNIFYNKENVLLVKSFNIINNQIRENINKIILNKNKHFLYESKKNIEINNDKDKINKIQNEIINKIINNQKIKYNIKYINCPNDKIINKKTLSNMHIKKRKTLNCINSRICFPYLFKDNTIMNKYSNKNYLEYKKYIETQ